MENVTEALKMAGSVLLFVVALSICIMLFTQARETIDAVVSFSDREYLLPDVNDSNANYYNLFYYSSNNGEVARYVGIETIIPSLYRAYKENYKVIFKFDDDYYLYKKKNETGEMKTVNKIDLAQTDIPIGSDEKARIFLDGILYRNYEGLKKDDSNQTEVELRKNYYETFQVNFEGNNEDKGLYKYLQEKLENNKKIKETLGTYYQDDIEKEESSNNTSEELADKFETAQKQEANKTRKRVITYTFE